MTTALIIDDHPDIRLLMRHVIELSGHGVDVIAEAEDGQAALDVLLGLDPDTPTVVVTDWMMPGMDGIEVSVLIKADRPAVRIILCSAYGDAAMERTALDAGIDLVISKEQIGELPARILELTGG